MSIPTSQQDGSDDMISPSEKNELPIRKRRRVYRDRLCQVCGDKALARHFGALACETCKAFFRRNAFNRKAARCLFQGSCQVTIKTRRFCVACRLKKCLEVGMQADLILDDEAKKERTQKVNLNRSKKDAHNLSSESEGTLTYSAVFSVTTTGPEIVTGPEITQPDMAHNSEALTDQQTRWQPVAEVNCTDRTVTKTYASAAGNQWNRTAIPVTFVNSCDGTIASGSQWNRTGLPVVVMNSSASSSCPKSHLDSTPTPVVMGQKCEMVISNPETLTTKMMACSNQDRLVPLHVIDISSPPTPPTPTVPHPPQQWHQQPSPLPSPPSAPSQPQTQPTTEDFPQLSPSLLAQSQLLNSFTHVPRDALPSDPYMYWRLSEEERCLLTQLSAAYQDTLLSILKGSPPSEFVPSEFVTQEVYLQECEREARNAVSFAKRMEDFRQLRTDEQIALLKASTNQVLGIRSCALYIVEKNAWLTRMGYFTLEHVEKIMPGHPVTDLGVAFCRSVKSIVKNDMTLYALLHCVMLFNPCDERVIDRHLINSIRDKYIILLRHYLQSVYSYGHSDKYMMALQGNLIFFRSLCQECKPLMKRFFPSIPNQLLVELMDWH